MQSSAESTSSNVGPDWFNDPAVQCIVDAALDNERTLKTAAYPCSAASLANCIEFLDAFPQLKARFKNMDRLPGWGGFVQNWELLTSVYQRDRGAESQELRRLVLGITLEYEVGPSVLTKKTHACFVVGSLVGDGIAQVVRSHIKPVDKEAQLLMGSHVVAVIPEALFEGQHPTPLSSGVAFSAPTSIAGLGPHCRVVSGNSFPLEVGVGGKLLAFESNFKTSISSMKPIRFTRPAP